MEGTSAGHVQGAPSMVLSGESGRTEEALKVNSRVWGTPREAVASLRGSPAFCLRQLVQALLGSGKGRVWMGRSAARSPGASGRLPAPGCHGPRPARRSLEGQVDRLTWELCSPFSLSLRLEAGHAARVSVGLARRRLRAWRLLPSAQAPTPGPSARSEVMLCKERHTV